MKRLGIIILALGLIFGLCNHENKLNAQTKNNTPTLKPSEISKDKAEIQMLIRHMLSWANSGSSIHLIPLVNNKNSVCIGFDLNKLQSNLEKLKETNFFTKGFIENYKDIILTLNKKIKDGEFPKWDAYGELPPFNFANDVNPWCLCQDNLEWKDVVVKIIKLNKEHGELIWKWGNLKSDYDSSWKQFEYRFNVEKEDGEWKISYLQGFDYKKGIQ